MVRMEGVGGHSILFSWRLGFSLVERVAFGACWRRVRMRLYWVNPLQIYSAIIDTNPRGFLISTYKMDLFWRVFRLSSEDKL